MKITSSSKKSKLKTLNKWILEKQKAIEYFLNIENELKNDIEEKSQSVIMTRNWLIDEHIEYKNLTKEQLKEKFIHRSDSYEQGELKIPRSIGKFEIEQTEFDSVSEVKEYIDLLNKEAYKNICCSYYYISSLISRAKLFEEILTDYSEKIEAMRKVITAHTLSIKKLINTKTTSSKVIDRDMNTIAEFKLAINSLESQIINNKNLINSHIEHLRGIPLQKAIQKDIINKTYIVYTKEFYEDPQNKLLLDEIIKKDLISLRKKRKKWIRTSIKKVRTTQKKLLELTVRYEKFKLEIGSRGERAIRIYLKNNNIEFEEQKRFKTCVNKALLPFDFYLPNNNLLIEFDGEQHYKAIDLFGGEEGFINRQINDKIKDIWAKDNNYILYRIKFDLIEKLDEVLTNIFLEYKKAHKIN